MKGNKLLVTMVAAFGLGATAISMPMVVNASGNNVYDISEWQQNLTDQQVQQLKNEVPFVILRVQYGSAYADKQFQHNRDMMDKYGIPYGVYSFSQYENPDDAANEARALYNRAPNARFYVNDYEKQTVKYGGTNKSTRAWVDALRPLVGNRKILFYSYADFMLRHASYAISHYDGYWLAAYQNDEPKREHVLWQFSQSFHSNALNENLDASALTQRDANWFLGDPQAANNPNSAPQADNNNNQPANSDLDKAQQQAQQNAGSEENKKAANSNKKHPAKKKPAKKKKAVKKRKPAKKRVIENVDYSRISNNLTIKSGTGLKLYKHVPGDNKFAHRNGVKHKSSTYGSKRIHIDMAGKNKNNGRLYYRIKRGNRNLGWINANGVTSNISYSSYHTTKTVKVHPSNNFYAHVAGGTFTYNKMKHRARTYAKKRVQIRSRAIKDGWHSYYYKAYYHNHFIGWVYQSSLRK